MCGEFTWYISKASAECISGISENRDIHNGGSGPGF